MRFTRLRVVLLVGIDFLTMATPTSQVETRAHRRANELRIVTYLLGEVTDLKDAVKYIIQDQGYGSISMLKEMTLEDIKEMNQEKDSPLKRAQKPILLKLLAIMDDILALEQPPSTFEQWEQLVANDELEAYKIATEPELGSIVPSVIQ